MIDRFSGVPFPPVVVPMRPRGTVTKVRRYRGDRARARWARRKTRAKREQEMIKWQRAEIVPWHSTEPRVRA